MIIINKDITGGIKNITYKDNLLIMDNVVIHKSKIVRQTIEESGNHLLYSVPYHPRDKWLYTI